MLFYNYTINDNFYGDNLTTVINFNTYSILYHIAIYNYMYIFMDRTIMYIRIMCSVKNSSPLDMNSHQHPLLPDTCLLNYHNYAL